MTIKGIEQEVLQNFKAWASLHGKTVKQAIIDYMKDKGREVKLEKQK